MTALSDQSVARLLTVGFCGHELTGDLRSLLDRGVSGVVLFSRNIEGPKQVAELIRSIKRHAGRPLYVGIDQEGGLVQRLRTGFTRVPPMRALGGLEDAELAERLGRLLGRELRAVGVDCNYAPVLDVDTNPDNPVIGNRSLSRDPGVVAQLGTHLGRGMQEAGVAACGKHFPGHGDTYQDSHLDLPHLPHELKRLQEIELMPFAAWAQAGLASVMTAHVVFDKLDDEYPATMSERVLQGLLRKEVGFDGLVFSDDLEMKAISEHFGCSRAAVLGLQAGVDNFLCCHSTDVAHGIIDAIVEAADHAEVDPRRVVEAEQRNQNFVRRWARPAEAARLQDLATEDSWALIDEIRRRADPEALVAGTDPTVQISRTPSGQERSESEQQ